MKVFDKTLLQLPLFDDSHRDLAEALEGWVEANRDGCAELCGADGEAQVRRVAEKLGSEGWLTHAIGRTGTEVRRGPDFRAISLIRHAFASCHDIYDYVFSIQALSAHAVAQYGSEAQKTRYLSGVETGRLLGSFAISEPQSGSDVAGIALRAVPGDHGFVLSGQKAWIANGSVADFHCVLARVGDGPAPFSMALFVVPANSPGLLAEPKVSLMAPRPLSGLQFEGCRIPSEALIGKSGHGYRYALETLERFRITVGAAANGFATRAMSEALGHSRRRRIGDDLLGDLQLTKERLADMQVQLDASSLLVARAAWEVDTGRLGQLSRHASVAKVFATEGAQRVIDSALQMFGAAGLVTGSPSEALYRQVRALRIYEGASEVQKLIIAGSLS